jgi:hypothetical protein
MQFHKSVFIKNSAGLLSHDTQKVYKSIYLQSLLIGVIYTPGGTLEHNSKHMFSNAGYLLQFLIFLLTAN